MNLEEKNKIIEKGKTELNKNIFPNKIIENIKEKRLREDITKQVFYTKGIQYEDLSPNEKEIRKSRLNIKILFDDYLNSLSTFKSLSYLLIIIGLLLLVSSLIIYPKNVFFGCSTILISMIILLVSISKERIIQYGLYTLIAYTVLYAIEFLIFGLPSSFIFENSNDLLVSKRGAITKIVNQVFPYIYMMSRIIIGVFLFINLRKINKFIDAKNDFEKSSK